MTEAVVGDRVFPVSSGAHFSRRDIDWAGYALVAFFGDPVPDLQRRAGAVRHLCRLHRVGHHRRAALDRPRQLPRRLRRRMGPRRLHQHLPLRAIIVPGVTLLGLAFAIFVNAGLAALVARAHDPLHPQRRLRHRDRARLGVGARQPVRRAEPLSRLSRHRPDPLAHQHELVAGRRLDRLDLVGHGARLRALPRRAAERAARPLRGGRDRRRGALRKAPLRDACRISARPSAW